MFKQLKHITVAMAIAAVAPGAAALDLPVKTVNGKQYYYYRIQAKETIYSLTNKLGVKRGDIVKYNPSAADGLRAGDTLYFPVSDFSDSESASSSTATTSVANSSAGLLTHKVAKGETLYAISKHYGVTTDHLIALNPSARDGIKAGAILVIHEGAEVAPEANTGIVEAVEVEDPSVVLPDLTVNNEPVSAPQFQEEKSTQEIQEAHDLTNTKEAQLVITPAPIGGLQSLTSQEVNPVEPVPADRFVQVTDTTEVLPDEDTPRNNGRIDIAVMLPFMLEKHAPTKQALLYTDFYKGLLMAVDTLRSSDTPIHIHTYDTAADLDKVNEILARPEMLDMDVIIAPEDSAQIEAIAEFADGTDAAVINLFAVKNNSYRQHPCLINANIPHEMMYDKAITNFIQRFDGYTPVLLINGEGDGDKKAFVDTMRERLAADNIDYREVTYSGSLRDADVAWMEPDGKYVFVPSSGSRAELLRLLPTMLDKRASMAAPDNVRLFGYPEWVILRGDVANKLHQMNAVIYSRFVADSDNYRTRNLERRFQEWYGNAMTPTAPMQGTLGYDTGMWIIKALTSTPGEDLTGKNFVYHGLQSGFDLLQNSDMEGMVNESLYFIYFLPDGELDKIVL